ncbi:MAG TPA: hypothetical protein PLY95_03545 [Candidatus Paceibacterota bacterium]|nr:hypothetical protein [Candidatus Paceibacterota bacterium]
MNQAEKQNVRDFAEAVISASVKLGAIFYLLNGEARNQQPGDSASLTDKASTCIGSTIANERHGNDISREL